MSWLEFDSSSQREWGGERRISVARPNFRRRTDSVQESHGIVVAVADRPEGLGQPGILDPSAEVHGGCQMPAGGFASCSVGWQAVHAVFTHDRSDQVVVDHGTVILSQFSLHASSPVGAA